MNALIEVLVERRRQQLKWGDDHDEMHTSQDWDRFIEARLHAFYDDGPETTEEVRRKLMIQIAALALACLEADDRDGLAMRT